MQTNRRRSVGLALLAGLLLVACQWSARGADDPDYYPGLPEASFPNGGWAASSQVGMSETAKALQWVRVPALTAAAWSGTEPSQVDPEPGVHFRQQVKADVVFVSPPGYTEGYGHLAPLTVRTVGFGLMPAEATVEVSQRRGADGLPIPLHVALQQDVLDNGDWIFYPAHITDAFDVRVTRIVVDGIDIGLTGPCETVKPAPVDLHGSGFTIPSAVTSGGANRVVEWLWDEHDPSTFFHPVYGGQLDGTVEIPAFTGCTTSSGDDLSAMITASVAGPDNHVVFRTKGVCALPPVQGRTWPPAPGENTPARSGCAAPAPLPYPQRR